MIVLMQIDQVDHLNADGESEDGISEDEDGRYIDSSDAN
jgi:hypothetical protein